MRGPERFFGKRKVCCRQKRIVLKSFGGPATVTVTVPRRLLDHVKHNTMFPTSLRALFWKKTRLKKAPHKSRELLKLFRARPSRSRTGVFKIRSLAQQYNLVVLSRLSPKVQKVIPTNTPRGVSTSDAQGPPRIGKKSNNCAIGK